MNNRVLNEYALLSREDRCNHIEKDRSWVGTYATVEIELALEVGYKIIT